MTIKELFMAFGVGAMFASSVHAFSVQEGVYELMQTNPVIQERLDNYKATLQDVRASYAGYLPSLDLSSGMGIEKTKTPSMPTTKSFNVYEHSLTLTQNLFNGFGTMNQISHHEARLMASANFFIDKTNDTVFAFVKAYIDVLKTKDLLDISKANVKFNEDIFDKVSKLYTGGMTTLSEAEKADTSLSLSVSNMIVAKNNLEDALFTLSRHLGRTVKAEELDAIEFDPTLPKTSDEIVQYALDHNPAILVSQYNIKAAQELHNERKRKFLPRVDFLARQNKNQNVNGVEGDDNRFKATVTLSMNLFAGGADIAEFQKTSSQISQEQNNKAELLRQVKEQSELSWSSYTYVGQQLQQLYRYRKTSQKTLMLYQKEYDLGRRTLLDLLVAQNDYIAAQTQICKGEYDYMLAKFRILDAMGTMVATVAKDHTLAHAKQVGLDKEVEKLSLVAEPVRSVPPKTRKIDDATTEVITKVAPTIAPTHAVVAPQTPRPQNDVALSTPKSEATMPINSGWSAPGTPFPQGTSQGWSAPSAAPSVAPASPNIITPVSPVAVPEVRPIIPSRPAEITVPTPATTPPPVYDNIPIFSKISIDKVSSIREGVSVPTRVIPSRSTLSETPVSTRSRIEDVASQPSSPKKATNRVYVSLISR